jgi:CBS domain-containing protein
MATTVREVMTANLVTYPSTATVAEAAQAMREWDIGDVLVETNGRIAGIVTDRDIVVRAIAEGRAPGAVKLADICSELLVTVSPDDPIEEAVKLMRDNALRRMPVCEGDRAVGIVTLGDLAMERDGASALADISAAPPNG